MNKSSLLIFLSVAFLQIGVIMLIYTLFEIIGHAIKLYRN